jgi:hypothetical protein
MPVQPGVRFQALNKGPHLFDSLLLIMGSRLGNNWQWQESNPGEKCSSKQSKGKNFSCRCNYITYVMSLGMLKIHIYPLITAETDS